jgi:peptide/nickel transport system ATP-binding protein
MIHNNPGIDVTPIDSESVLQIENLSVSFETALGRVRAAENVCFDLRKGETLALVGETGCGKSVVASAIMRLLPPNASVRGRAVYAGRDLFALGEKQMADIRGSEISIIFQNPSLALNPIMPVAEQIGEMLRLRKGVSSGRSAMMAWEMASSLGLGSREKMKMYPFQFSGGMNQRVMIATSLMLSPRIIIADEPSKALDASTAGEAMAEMMRIKRQTKAALLLITHDLGLAKEISDRIAVMYCGEIVELASSREVFSKPLHPYTEALLNCLPERGFQSIPGVTPSMIHPPDGCRFSPRCPQRQDKCNRKPEMACISGQRGGCGSTSSDSSHGSDSFHVSDGSYGSKGSCGYDDEGDINHSITDREVRCWLY